MTHRERVRAALSHQEPDRVPMDIGGIASTLIDSCYHRLKDYLGVSATDDVIWPDWSAVAKVSGEVLRILDADFCHVRMTAPDGWQPERFPDGTWTNEWGTRFRKFGHYTEMVGFPLENAELPDLDAHPWPDVRDKGRTRGLRDYARQLFEDTDYALATFDIGRLFEWCQWLRGMEKFLEDLVLRPRFAEELLDRVLEVQIGLFDGYLDAVGEYVEIVTTGDDLGTQSSLLISPEMYRKFLKPRHRKLFDFIKSKTRAKVWFHTDGVCRPLLDDLVEIGVDVLNPVQPRVKDMSQRALKRSYGDRLCFWGGVDEQQVLPYGTPADVEAEVVRVLEELGPGGGFILAPAHNFQPDVSPQNITALYQAGRRWGTYPLSPRS
jgi:uroporphyrinogen decarboxylase